MHFTKPERHTARKQHRCSTCFRDIDSGERYSRSRGFDAGEAWTWKTCPHCEAVSDLYDPRDLDNDLISYDGFDNWAQWLRPKDWAEARAQVGWRARWRYRSGRLMPIPSKGGN